jgi:hypothetical protein
MAEALGIIGLLPLTFTVCSLSTRYISCMKNASTSLLNLQNELKNLEFVLTEINLLLEIDKAAGRVRDRQSILSSIGDTVELKDALERIQSKLDKEFAKSGFPARFRKILWPFNEEEINKTLEVFQRYLGVFGLALGIDARHVPPFPSCSIFNRK